MNSSELIAIISEATRRLPDGLKQRYRGINGIAIGAAGNVYRHEYEAVDDRLIWYAELHGLDELKALANAEVRL